MNHCVPDWSMEDDLRSFHSLLPPSSQKKSMTSDNDLMEILWRNGHVTMQSQNNRRPPLNEFRQAQKTEPQLKPVTPPTNRSNLIQEDENGSWFQYSLEDPLGKEFFLDFLRETPTTNVNNNNNKASKEAVRALEDGNALAMPPPKTSSDVTQLAPSWGNGAGPMNFSHFARPMNNDMKLKLGSRMVLGVSDSSSIRTAGSSACGSNQVPNQADASRTLSTSAEGLKDGCPKISPFEGLQTNTLDATTVTTSSGGSGCSFGRITGQQSTSNQNEKRKGRDGDVSECPSEEAENESTEANRLAKRPASTCKSRAAEVHNLSERRRRDRINEKMKALQELIPHCDKSDKASMLDEAIEYLKSLQLQLQLMWMGSGMAPILFPGIQQYMPHVSMGVGHASMPLMNNPIQLSTTPLVNHSMSSTPTTNQMPACSPQAVNPMNFTTQVQNVHLPEPYAQYFCFPRMQPGPQAMNLYVYGSHMVQQNQTAGIAGSSGLPTTRIPSENIQNGQSGKSAAMGTFPFY